MKSNTWPYFEKDEQEAVQKVLESGKVNYWTGTECREFEKEFSDYCGVKHAVAVFNGTVALELALYSLGIGAGDEVIVTSRTFIASASCCVMRGAKPVMADVDSISQNITAETVRAKITNKTKAIICVHLAGWPCDMDSIMELAREYNLYVIEDCAQAHGAKYKGKLVGSIGHAAAYSFCQDKIMTTGGEGGMFLTNDEEVWKRAWGFKDHGKSYDAVYKKAHAPGFRWLHESFGTNWRMTEMQATIGRCQLRKLDGWIEKRRNNAKMLNEAFSELEALRLTIPDKHFFHAYYKYYVFVRPEKLKSDWNRDRIMEEINAQEIPCFSGSCSEIYLEKAFDLPDFRPDKPLNIAKELGNTSLMFLVHPTLTEQDIKDMIKIVKTVILKATG